jgi:hypothetical protein
MAVTKIRRLAGWTLILIALLSVAVFALYYLGGVGEPLNGDMKNPIYTGALLYWMYALLGLSALFLVIFGVLQFAGKFKNSPKAALTSLAVLVFFVAILFLAYSIGNDTPLTGINADSQTYNTPQWLKITDMWLYAMYILLGFSIVALFWGSIKKILSK